MFSGFSVFLYNTFRTVTIDLCLNLKENELTNQRISIMDLFIYNNAFKSSFFYIKVNI